MAASESVRYSTANVDESEPAKGFSWEAPVPVNPFWDSFDYCLSRNFLGNFSKDELAQLPIDPRSAASDKEKLELLLKLLEEKLVKEDAAATPKTPYELDYMRWNSLLQGIYTYQVELGLHEADQTIRLMVDKRPDKSNNIVPLHMLADHLVKVGEYKKAETEKHVCAWMDAQKGLGKDSPQAINARRIIVRAMWKQGSSRRAEAEALIVEIKEITETMRDGRFGIYQEEERELTEKMMKELKKAD